MSEELNLLPCPRCGKNVTAKLDRMNEYYVFCCETTADSIEAWNDLPRALTWTTEPPQVPGKYWHRDVNTGQLGVLTVEKNYRRLDDVSLYAYDGLHRDCMGKVENIGGEWAGPIPAPKEPTP